MEGAGIVMGSDIATHTTRIGNTVRVAIPTSSYQNANQIPWTDMRSLKFNFEGDDSIETKVSLVRVCDDFPSPSFCSIATSDEYATNCRDCNCQTCHACGCSTSSPWGSCSHGACDGSGCWCSALSCKCCQDCEGYECNCANCCDNENVESCSLGGTYKVSSLSPANGIANEATDVLVTGTDFYRNAEAMTCTFGDVVVQASFLSSTSIKCSAPPVVLVDTEEIRAVTFSVSLAEPDSTDPATHSFTYVKCPSGCSDTCAA